MAKERDFQNPWSQRKVGLETLFGVGLTRSITNSDPTCLTNAESGLRALAEEMVGTDDEPAE